MTEPVGTARKGPHDEAVVRIRILSGQSKEHDAATGGQAMPERHFAEVLVMCDQQTSFDAGPRKNVGIIRSGHLLSNGDDVESRPPKPLDNDRRNVFVCENP